MSQPILITDIQFTAPNQEKERQLVVALQQTQQALNTLIRENEQLRARVAALEAGP